LIDVLFSTEADPLLVAIVKISPDC
jgi:hypothetical protein